MEGLAAYEAAAGRSAEVTAARRRAEVYLLERHMLRSLRSGKIIDEKWTRFAFPMVWHYDVLRGLEYFRAAGASYDERMGEALALVEKRRHQNGKWPRGVVHEDRIGFEMEGGRGTASRWNTLRALRVLKWFGR